MSPKDKSSVKQWNAETQGENTKYQFSSSNYNFLKALKMYWSNISNFSETKETLNEVNAVNSEFMLDLKNEDWLVQLLSQSLSDNKASPYGRFSIGNTETLYHEGVEKEVYNFFEKFYRTKNLTISVLTNSASKGANSGNKKNKTCDVKNPVIQLKKKNILRKIDQTFQSKQTYNNKCRKFEKSEDLQKDVEEIINQKRATMSDKTTEKLPKTGLPFKNLPIILFMKSPHEPKLNLSWYFDTPEFSKLDIVGHVSFICFWLEKLAIRKFVVEEKQIETEGVGIDSSSLFNNLQIDLKLTDKLTYFLIIL